MEFVVPPSPELVLLKLVGKALRRFHPPKPACLEPFGKAQGAGNAWGGIPHPGCCLELKYPQFCPLSKRPSALCFGLHVAGNQGGIPLWKGLARVESSCLEEFQSHVDVACGDTWGQSWGNSWTDDPRINDSMVPTSIIP